jgi:hypothetical protein
MRLLDAIVALLSRPNVESIRTERRAIPPKGQQDEGHFEVAAAL